MVSSGLNFIYELFKLRGYNVYPGLVPYLREKASLFHYEEFINDILNIGNNAGLRTSIDSKLSLISDRLKN